MDWKRGLKKGESGMTPGLLTGSRCLVVVFVEVENKEKESCLV